MEWSRQRVDRGIALVSGTLTALILGGGISRSFDYDESVAVASVISRGSARIALTETTVLNNHPVFAAWQSVWWDLGGAGELRQRIFPVLYGALAVALLAGWCSRRFGPSAAVAAAAAMVINPMFVTQARAVRGYSLALLAVVVSLLALVEYVRQGAPPGRRGNTLLVVHAAGIVVAMGTHLFAGAALGPVGLASLFVIGRLDRRVVTSWIGAATGVALVYAATVNELADTAAARGSMYRPTFGRAVLAELLGRESLTAAVFAGLAVFALLSLVVDDVPATRRLGLAATAAVGLVGAQILYVWKVATPFDLYPRFFLVVVPLVAVLVAVAVRSRPALLALVLLASLVGVDTVAQVRSRELGLREAGAVIAEVNEGGGGVCAVGTEALVLYASGAPIRELWVSDAPAAELFRECDLFVRVGSWGRPLDGPAGEHFAHGGVIGSIRVFSAVPLDALGA